ncbi:MAG: TonB-dependent receptor [Acidimicrobiia bacterium]|nr:TonB-dependent receptor [Acidimicrobiia bacterium]
MTTLRHFPTRCEARTWFLRIVLTAIALALVPSAGFAQYGAISGVVRDTTGAVLPGVTVEATSPALIEKVRSAVSDEQGLYRILDLPPGTYSVSFTLSGFSTHRRDGIELSTGFTAPVNADLRIGALEETVVVSGQTPLVDVQNVREQRVITREVIDLIPTGSRSFDNLAALIPGVRISSANAPTGQDVGGTRGAGLERLAIHGGRVTDQMQLVDGMWIGAVQAISGSSAWNQFSDGNVEEMTFGLGAHSAESETGGVQVNLIPRSGGNAVRSRFVGNFANGSLQSNNYSDELRDRGLAEPNKANYVSDANPTLGGPIRQDQLWFFAGFRDNRRSNYVTDRYPDSNPNDWVYTPDRSTRPEDKQTSQDYLGRLTWQVTGKHKVAGFFNVNDRTDPFTPTNAGGNTTLAAQSVQNQTSLTRLAQVTWSAPVTNRLLFDAGVSVATLRFVTKHAPGAAPPAVRDTGTATLFRATGLSAGFNTGLFGPRLTLSSNYFIKGNVSYVWGGHSSKVGVVVNPTKVRIDIHGHGDIAYELRFLNGVPSAVAFTSLPYYVDERVTKMAFFAQDQWTMNRLTLNAGLRYDGFGTSYADYDIPATSLLPRRTFPGADVLSWKDLAPRLGLSWDVFGDARTAIKASVSRYVLAETTDITRMIDPPVASTNDLVRTWADRNGDFVPQGDPLNPVANGELGPSPNNNFGKPNITVRYDPDWTNGFQVRSFQWETTVGIQHEIMSGLSAQATYYRRSYRNFTVIDNQAVAPTDYSPFCVTAPSDARLPGGGGHEICGLFDLNPNKLGQVSNYRTLADNYGEQQERWHGVDLTMGARFANGALVQGGLSTGTTLTDNCDVVAKLDNPSPLYCHNEEPFLHQFKLLGSYTLPGRVQVSAAFQSVPGSPISASYVVRSAQIAPSLGRNLSAGANATVSVNVIEPNSVFGDRLNQLDIRFGRPFTVGRARVSPAVDLFNALNANTVLAWNNTYGTNGATWLAPRTILTGRLVKFGVQIDF